MLEKYEEFSKKRKVLSDQKKQLKQKISNLNKQQLKNQMDKYNRQRQDIANKMSNYSAGSSSFS